MALTFWIFVKCCHHLFQLSNFHAVFETAWQEQLLVHLGATVLTALFSEQLLQ
jgi:hypothetical protein